MTIAETKADLILALQKERMRLKHGPDESGADGDCRASCAKCAVEAAIKALGGTNYAWQKRED